MLSDDTRYESNTADELKTLAFNFLSPIFEHKNAQSRSKVPFMTVPPKFMIDFFADIFIEKSYKNKKKPLKKAGECLREYYSKDMRNKNSFSDKDIVLDQKELEDRKKNIKEPQYKAILIDVFENHVLFNL